MQTPKGPRLPTQLLKFRVQNTTSLKKPTATSSWSFPGAQGPEQSGEKLHEKHHMAGADEPSNVVGFGLLLPLYYTTPYSSLNPKP